MGISYEAFSSPLVNNSELGFWKAGHRCPDVILYGSRDQAKWLYQIVEYGKFLLLSIGVQSDVTSSSEHLTIYNIVPTEGQNDDAHKQTRQIDGVQRFAVDWLNDGSQGFVVVRPDMYIGCVGESISAVEEYLDKVNIKLQKN